MKRALDIALASAGIVLLSPILAVAALSVRLSSPGPIIYRASRIGRGGRRFTMYKFRTMHAVAPARASRITAARDSRVFPLGRLLRRLKLDELPQLVNVVRGDMSIVGPRPEDPEIVERYYTANERETLRVRPGLASPGSIYYYTHDEATLDGSDVERQYAETVLPIKAALDRVYIQRASVGYDLRIIVRTAWALLSTNTGFGKAGEPPELAEARALLSDSVAARRDVDDPNSPTAASRAPLLLE